MNNKDEIIKLIEADDFGIFTPCVKKIFINLYDQFKSLKDLVKTSTEKYPIVKYDKYGNINYYWDENNFYIKKFDEKGRITFFRDKDFWYEKNYSEDGSFEYLDSYKQYGVYSNDEMSEIYDIKNRNNGY